jgi:hypothetical protein
MPRCAGICPTTRSHPSPVAPLQASAILRPCELMMVTSCCHVFLMPHCTGICRATRSPALAMIPSQTSAVFRPCECVMVMVRCLPQLLLMPRCTGISPTTRSLPLQMAPSQAWAVFRPCEIVMVIAHCHSCFSCLAAQRSAEQPDLLHCQRRLHRPRQSCLSVSGIRCRVRFSFVFMPHVLFLGYCRTTRSPQFPMAPSQALAIFNLCEQDCSFWLRCLFFCACVSSCVVSSQATA